MSSFVLHGFVPPELLKGVLSPLVKDKFGNLNELNNYRPVMCSSILFKIFEYCLLSKIEPYVEMNDRQHGFKKSYSTGSACFCLKETMLSYTNANSNVYSCFIDISKAFDSVDHNIMIQK